MCLSRLLASSFLGINRDKIVVPHVKSLVPFVKYVCGATPEEGYSITTLYFFSSKQELSFRPLGYEPRIRI